MSLTIEMKSNLPKGIAGWRKTKNKNNYSIIIMCHKIMSIIFLSLSSFYCSTDFATINKNSHTSFFFTYWADKKKKKKIPPDWLLNDKQST